MYSLIKKIEKKNSKFVLFFEDPPVQEKICPVTCNSYEGITYAYLYIFVAILRMSETLSIPRWRPFPIKTELKIRVK